MYILKNALKSIMRNKTRNILIGIVALVIATSACVALSIREAAETAKESTLKELTVTANITYDRSSVMSEMMENSSSSGEAPSKDSIDFSALEGESLTLDDYMTYTDALEDGDTYYYSITSSLNASGDLEAYTTEDSSDSSDDTTTSEDQQMPGGGGGFEFSAQGDFSLTGYSSYDAMLSLFGEDGTYSITDGSMFDETTEDAVCVISDELALYNDLAVGDTITLSNPNYEDETYELEIVGIYTNSASDSGSSAFSRTDPANNIYLSYNSLQAILDASETAGNTETDDDGNETAANLTSEITFTYALASADRYYEFEDAITEIGLPDNYIVSSSDLASFESSITPLETLSSMAGWFFLIVLGVGGIILIVLNVFNLRERKYEVGVLTAIGMKKGKVALQYVYELFFITFIAIVIGATAGAVVSVPVTNTLLANQIESAESSTDTLNSNFGFQGGSDTSGSGRSGNPFTASTTANQDVSYIDSVSSATNLVVILELVGVGIFLTVISSLGAMVTIMRYEPLKILSSRS